MTERKVGQNAESSHQTVSLIYAAKTLRILALENIGEVLPQRPQIDEAMSHAIFWLYEISSKDWGKFSSSTKSIDLFKMFKQA